PDIKTIIFDEFLTNNVYLKDEFILFMNTVSTIVRRRDNVKIYMLGNTVSRHSPHFSEMGLTHILEMEQGTIDLYHFGESELSVAVEYCSTSKSERKSNKYFAFNNPKLRMITGGSWELDLYKKLPIKYENSDVILKFFIVHNN